MFWSYVKFISILAILVFISVAIVGVFGLLIQKIVVYMLVGIALLLIYGTAYHACFVGHTMEHQHD